MNDSLKTDLTPFARAPGPQTSPFLFNAVLNQVPSAVIVVDARTRKVVFANDRNRQIFRLTADLNDAADHALFCGFQADGRPIEPDRWPLARSLRDGEIVTGEEICIERGDGSEGYIRVSSTPIRDEGGAIVAAVVMYDDVTDATRAALALQEQGRVNETLLRINSAFSSELDVDVLMQLLTDEATKLCRAQFGSFFYNVKNHAGESYMLYTLSGVSRDAFADFPMPRNTAIFAPTFSGTEVVRSGDITKDPRYGKNQPHCGMPQGHLPVRSYLAVPVKSRSGGVLGGLFFGHGEPNVFTDQDERLIVAISSQASVAIDNATLYRDARRAEALAELERGKMEGLVRELENAAHMKDEFLATVSHELRTPLTAMLGWVRMLRSGALAEDRKARALETIERNAIAQTQLIADLLDVSRIISGKLRLDVTTVDLPTVVENAIEALRPAILAKGVILQPTVDPLATPILGDGERLQQVIWNLLSNAVKFTPRGGRVQVAVRKRDSAVEIVVRDTGQGIDPAFLAHAFERFRQADGATTRAHGGLGLGLAIVRHLVELHGGTVLAESAGEGKGSTFTVSLPISPLRAAPIERPPPVRLIGFGPELRCPPELAGVRVLVVDDEPDARELLAAVLAPCKAEVTTAASTAEAFALFQERRPDILVSDIGMPGEDGYALIRKVRSLPAIAGGRTPAVALTAYARMEDRTRTLLAGFNMHVPKPVEPSELLIVLASLNATFRAADTQ
jgi:signal transduction histidine kinase/ActR/RegA family two-component response regulator